MITDLFSKRRKRSRGEVPDVYQYETIPKELRIQVIHIWVDAFGEIHASGAASVYGSIHKKLCREYGMATLGESHDSHLESIVRFFSQTEDAAEVIDIIELSFRYIDQYVRIHTHEFTNRKISPDDAIIELNHRFHEHGVGYQYESGIMVRVDSQFIHSEAVRPALSMLSAPMYEGANAEFLSAHEHYRSERYKECLNDCLKAFESCIKAICKKRKWGYDEKDTASRLIEIVFSKELVPCFMQSHFSTLKNTLTDGIPSCSQPPVGTWTGARRSRCSRIHSRICTSLDRIKCSLVGAG